ncbi:MAG: hypothetical protein P8K14_04150 [Flavobacteriaceae bacterium]|nr:hypothetical protein [Flavobacteriaceae bacterium]
MTNLLSYLIIIFTAFYKVQSQEIFFPLEEDSIVKKLILQKKEIDSEEYGSNYYTIQLYYGNYLVAKEILDEFRTNYPEWKASIIFETPNYKVQVGDFKNYYVSISKLNEIKKKYPSAFLLKLKL